MRDSGDIAARIAHNDRTEVPICAVGDDVAVSRARRTFGRSRPHLAIVAAALLGLSALAASLALTDEDLGVGSYRDIGPTGNRLVVGIFAIALLVGSADYVIRVIRDTPDVSIDDVGVHIRSPLRSTNLRWDEIAGVVAVEPRRKTRPTPWDRKPSVRFVLEDGTSVDCASRSLDPNARSALLAEVSDRLHEHDGRS